MTRLTLREVTAGYRGRPVLGPVSLTADGGRVLGLIGPNGSGKSTLVRAVAGLHPHTGEVEAIGRPGREARDVIGYLPQDLPAPVALTVLESVLVASGSSRTRPGAAEVGHAVGHLEGLGIGDLADRYLGELSGGQRQLAGLAQLLSREPDVLLLDEPTSALDLHHQVEVLRLVRATVATRGALALVVLHDLNLAAAFCDGLAVLRQGRLVAQGPPGEVLTRELLRETYGVEARVLDVDGTPVVAPLRADEEADVTRVT